MNNNRGYYDNRNRRRPRKRVTGRFYAFLSVMVVLVVMAAVFFSTRGRQPSVPAMQPASVQTPAAVTTPEPQPTDNVVPAPGANLDDPAAAPGGSDPAEPAGAQTGSGSIQAILDDEIVAPLSDEEKTKADSDFNAVAGLPSEWRNILLLGTDTREWNKVTRTDTIMIASINTNDGRIKLTSIMRDTIVPIPKKDGSVAYEKINSASYYGDAELTMQVINECFQMNITEYVMVNFESFRNVVDILGGIKVDITKEEMEYINQHVHEQVILLVPRDQWNSVDYNLKTFGQGTLLNGMQALAYSRIRHLDSDYRRTERQRIVIEAILKKVRTDMGVKQALQMVTTLYGNVKTNISLGSAVALAGNVLKNGLDDISMSGRIPANDTFVSETRNGSAALYDVDYQANATKLHDYIYNK